MQRRINIALIALLLTHTSCGGGSTTQEESHSSSDKWKRAKSMWQGRDARAHRIWTELNPESPEGKEASRLMKLADVHYREGIDLFADGKFKQALKKLKKGTEAAPINPVHYFAIARIYRDRGLSEVAAKYYQKTINTLPGSPTAQMAKEEYKKLEPDLTTVFDPPKEREQFELSFIGVSYKILIAIVIVVSMVVALLVLLRLRSESSVSLDRLIDQSPELHSAIAYLIGSLRHELLKHRIGAVSDVISGLKSGRSSNEQLVFLRDRLYGDVPVQEAWNIHVTAFVSALGNRLSLRKDSSFYKASRAIETIAALETQVINYDSSATAELAKAYEQLKLFDHYLAAQQARLVRTLVDDALMSQIVGEVRGEYTISSIALDELTCEPVTNKVHIEVPRDDLILILKNILRNAILSVERNQNAKRVRLSVRVHLEATGEEVVSIGVSDTSTEHLSTDSLNAKGSDSGLGLVATAVRRYSGIIEAIQCEGRYEKEVLVRFFRAFEDDTENQWNK
ncbi:MAG: GHKL domain-containing protein [Proteobacteria bacterium]|nr:GHKL domain-containing protein [Pseudomonadota bacterium]